MESMDSPKKNRKSGFQKGHVPFVNWNGRKHSNESKKKMSDAHRGKFPSPETRRRMSEAQKQTGNKPPQTKYWLGKKRPEISKLMSKIHKGRKISEATRKKLSESHKGEKSYLWKGGITPVNAKIRNSLEMRLWRKSVFERDDYTCVFCGLRSGKGVAVVLHADHIKRFSDYPELRFAIDNGRTLCKECHYKITWEKSL